MREPPTFASRSYRSRLLVGVLALVTLVLHAPCGWAQVVPPTSTQISPDVSITSLKTKVTPPLPGGTVFTITEGTRSDTNLFHSLDKFTIKAGDTALFSNVITINGVPVTGLPTSNILTRVIGGRSDIFGAIKTDPNFGAANLYLINPAGIIFGASAELNVGGAFHASTANYIGFGGGLAFCASLCANLPSNRQEGLSVARPEAFGFLSPGLISVEGSTLAAAPGRTLSVVGGDVRITGATLTAPGGRIEVASVASGEVTIPDFGVTASTRLGDIKIFGSLLNVSGDPAGAVFIRGGSLTTDGATIAAVTGNAAGQNPGIDVGVTGDAMLTNSTLLVTQTGGEGRGGDIRLSADHLTLTQGAFVTAQTDGSGRGGDISLTANRLDVDGVNADGAPSSIRTLTTGGGSGGNISLSVGTLSITGGANVGTTSDPHFDPVTFEPIDLGGPGGNVTVTADSVTISGSDPIFGVPSTINSVTGTSGAGGQLSLTAASSLVMGDRGTINSISQAAGPGGNIDVEVGQLGLTGGATISSSSVDTPAANLKVTATDSATISGPGSGLLSTSSFGRSGDIALTARQISLTDTAQIRSGEIFGGQGGNIALTANDSILISGRAGVSSQTFSGAEVGEVKVFARAVTVDDGFVTTSTLGTGPAGNIRVDAATVTLLRGAHIESSSELASTGPGGQVLVDATDSVSIVGTSPSSMPSSPFSLDASSGIFSTAHGSGSGGQIVVKTPTLALSDGGKISASSSGTVSALAGNVNIVTNNLTMNNGSITTESLRADGGNITITTTGSQVYLLDSRIITSVQSDVGSGGNITIGSQAHPIEFVVLNDSQIRADAFGGPGGNINIFADTYLTSDSVVSASSALSVPGTIDIQAKFTNLSGSIAQLPETVLQAAALLRAACAARLSAGKTSSLVVAGREGLPLEPGGVMPSPLIAESSTDLGPSRSDGREWEPLPGAWRVSLHSKCSM